MIDVFDSDLYSGLASCSTVSISIFGILNVAVEITATDTEHHRFAQMRYRHKMRPDGSIDVVSSVD